MRKKENDGGLGILALAVVACSRDDGDDAIGSEDPAVVRRGSRSRQRSRLGHSMYGVLIEDRMGGDACPPIVSVRSVFLSWLHCLIGSGKVMSYATTAVLHGNVTLRVACPVRQERDDGVEKKKGISRLTNPKAPIFSSNDTDSKHSQVITTVEERQSIKERNENKEVKNWCIHTMKMEASL